MNITFYEPKLSNRKYTIEYKASGRKVIPGCFHVTNEEGNCVELTDEEVFNIFHRGLIRLLGLKDDFIKRSDRKS